MTSSTTVPCGSGGAGGGAGASGAAAGGGAAAAGGEGAADADGAATSAGASAVGGGAGAGAADGGDAGGAAEGADVAPSVCTTRLNFVSSRPFVHGELVAIAAKLRSRQLCDSDAAVAPPEAAGEGARAKRQASDKECDQHGPRPVARNRDLLPVGCPHQIPRNQICRRPKECGQGVQRHEDRWTHPEHACCQGQDGSDWPEETTHDECKRAVATEQLLAWVYPCREPGVFVRVAQARPDVPAQKEAQTVAEGGSDPAGSE